MDKIPRVLGYILAAVMLTACGSGDSDGRSAATGEWAQERTAEIRNTPVPVEAVEVSRGSVLRSIESSGIVRGETEVTVISEAQGRIEQADFELGQFVEEGTPLVRVDDTVARLNVDEARGVYESARLDLEATQRRFENGSASQAELTRARSTANGALARLETALKTLRDQTVRAPVSGYIAARGNGISRGNFLERGVPVARIVDLNTLRIEVTVGEREVQLLEPGAEAAVFVTACRAEPYVARVFSIAAGADERTGSFPVVVRWENHCDVIRSGMSAGVRIAPRGDSHRIIVPGSAIRQDSGGQFVYVLPRDAGGDDQPNGVVERRDIVTGDRLGDRVQVLSGLSDGEIVLVSGLSAVSPGQTVDAMIIGRSGEVL